MKIQIKFIIKSNLALTLNDHFKELIEFQIERINHFYPNACWIFDPAKLLQQNSIQYDQVFSSDIELKKLVDADWENSLLVLIDSINPFMDMDLTEYLTNQFIKNNETLVVEGAIPGTFPNLVTSYNLLSEKSLTLDELYDPSPKNFKKIYWDTQRKHNSQFNLNRGLRVKIFVKLLHKIKSLYKLSLDDFIKILNDDEIYNFIFDYAVEGLHTEAIILCPFCNSNNLKPLYLTTSQAMIGFLSNMRPIYYECVNCSLVVLKKQCDTNDVKLFYDEYERPKMNEHDVIESYLHGKGTSHYVEKIKALELIESIFKDKISFVDLGGGFGEFACLAKKRNPLWDVQCVDLNLDHVRNLHTRYGVKSINANFLENEFGSDYDVITALHVIEHIPYVGLQLFFKNVHRCLKKDGYFLLTTPDYDSPLCKIFDYHLMYPPHHQTILSGSWIEKFILKNGLFRKIKQESACVILERYSAWFTYYGETSPNDETNSMVSVFDMIHNDPILFKKLKETVSSNKKGSETILLLQKQ